ncbi:hypothetical protein ABVK25_001224 [Lepraria finkii]|uniref:Rhodopsin domain-containing protein n=1 Tax=Lepraria finkii TaxID=1340010 RepID=A0ABR4BL13_9LECA
MAEPESALAPCSDNNGPMILIVSYVLMSTAIIAVVLRLYLRSSLRHGLSSDDYTIAASLVVGIIGVGCLTKLVHEGMGRHFYCLPPEQQLQAVKWSTISQICNVIGIGLCKISVCLCVLRILDRTRKGLATFLWIVIAFAAASHLAQVILFLVQCRPMAAIWNPHIQGKCFSRHITYLAGYIGFGLDASTDIICAGIPIFILHRLYISTRTKRALCLLMGLGSLTAGCAIAKAITLKGIFAFDFTWSLWKPAICTIIAPLAGVTLVSLPALPPLFSKMLAISNLTSGRGSSSKRSNRPYYPRWPGSGAGASGDTYALEKSLRSDDSENAGGGPSYANTIVKTTDFRLGSEHNSQTSQRLDDYWPLPLNSSTVTTAAERFERSAV